MTCVYLMKVISNYSAFKQLSDQNIHCPHNEGQFLEFLKINLENSNIIFLGNNLLTSVLFCFHDPVNVLFVDFGLSNTYDHGELMKTHCGSLEYAAPELIATNDRYGPEVDIWSM